MNIEIIKKISTPILIKHNVCRASLFGSFAHGTQNQHSDIDILVEFAAEARPTLFSVAELQNELANALGWKVDVVTPQAVSALILPSVLDGKITLL